MAVIGWNDWENKRIPDKFILSVFITGIMSMCLVREITLIQRLTGLAVVSVPLFLMAVMIPGSIGGGDIKLMAASGFLLGSAAVWRAFIIGVMTAGIYVLILLAKKKADRKSEIALGPFLCIGILFELMKI